MSLDGKPELTTAEPIANDGFWLALSMADLMSKYRLPSETPNPVIQMALTMAMVKVNDKLSDVKQAVLDMGSATFQAYISENSISMADSELFQIHYEHAVYSHAKAYMVPIFKTMIRREDAENEAKEGPQTEQDWLDESQGSIAYLMRQFFPENLVPNKANFHVALL